MPYPFTTYDEDPFAPEGVDEPDTVDVIERMTMPIPKESPNYPQIYEDEAYWNSPQMLGSGVGRPAMNDPRAPGMDLSPDPEDPVWGEPGRPTRESDYDDEDPIDPRVERFARGPMSTEDELSMVQKAMMPQSPYERPGRPGRPMAEGGGGGVGMPRQLENAIQEYANGGMSASAVVRIFKRHGWIAQTGGMGGFRAGGGLDLQVTDPSGKTYLLPGNQ